MPGTVLSMVKLVGFALFWVIRVIASRFEQAIIAKAGPLPPFQVVFLTPFCFVSSVIIVPPRLSQSHTPPPSS